MKAITVTRAMANARPADGAMTRDCSTSAAESRPLGGQQAGHHRLPNGPLATRPTRTRPGPDERAEQGERDEDEVNKDVAGDQDDGAGGLITALVAAASVTGRSPNARSAAPRTAESSLVGEPQHA